MKTLKLSLIVALVALTAGIWAQPQPYRDRGEINHDNQLVMTANYRTGMNGVERFYHHARNWRMPEESRGYYQAPEVTMSFFFENAEVIYDREYCMEAWMESPFEAELSEELVSMEIWMTTPFENDLAEEPLGLESWMRDPFEQQLAEEPLVVESWMTMPFENTEEKGNDSWMATSPR